CTPASSTTAWSSLADGTMCGAGQSCASGSCEDVCFIGSVLYPAGTLNPVDACQACTPTSSITAWSDLADGTTCGAGHVCAGGSCENECFIAGVLYPAGTPTPTNACQVCTPANLTKAWSLQTDGTSCDDGNPCTKGDACAVGTCLGTAYTCTPGICD